MQAIAAAIAAQGCRICTAVLVLAGLTAGAPTASPAAPPAGYFRVANIGGVWWLIDPAGSPTLSIGVDDVAYHGDKALGAGPSPYLDAVRTRYPDRAAWNAAALRRLRGWGFNTLGAWSDRELWSRGAPYTVILDLAARSGADWLSGRPADVYDPRFAETAREIAREVGAPRARDPLLVGYFSDNELWWGPDWRAPADNMLAAYLAFAPGAPGRRAAIEFLRARYHGDIRRLDRAWQVAAADFSRVPPRAETNAYRGDADAFLEAVAVRYFAVAAQAIRAADPNHLYLGARFAGVPPDPVLRAACGVDVVSVNLYTRDPRPAVAHVSAITGRPVLVTEFSFRSLDSGLPNTRGAGPWVFTQRTRGWAYAAYVARLESLPEAIGYHWFRWADEPKQGRADGENSNYGLVGLDDRPYAGFVAAVTAANREAGEVHRGVRPRRASGPGAWWRRWSIQDVLDAAWSGPRWVSTGPSRPCAASCSGGCWRRPPSRDAGRRRAGGRRDGEAPPRSPDGHAPPGLQVHDKPNICSCQGARRPAARKNHNAGRTPKEGGVSAAVPGNPCAIAERDVAP